MIKKEKNSFIEKTNRALPSTGQISLNDVRVELGRSNQISLNDTDVRKLAGKTSGQIAMSDLRGKSNNASGTITLGLESGAMDDFWPPQYILFAGFSSGLTWSKFGSCDNTNVYGVTMVDFYFGYRDYDGYGMFVVEFKDKAKIENKTTIYATFNGTRYTLTYNPGNYLGYYYCEITYSQFTSVSNKGSGAKMPFVIEV